MGRSVYQDDLFGMHRWLERTTASGAEVRVQLEPAGIGSVRIVRYERKRRGEREFQRRPREEGRIVTLASLAPEQDWSTLFGRR